MPIIRFTETVIAKVSALGKGTPASWWLAISDTRPITRFLHYRAGGKTGQQKRQGHHNHADLQKTPRDGWLGLKPKLCLYRRRGSRGAKILKHSTLLLPTSRESSKKEYADGKPRIPRSESQTLSTALLEA